MKMILWEAFYQFSFKKSSAVIKAAESPGRFAKNLTIFFKKPIDFWGRWCYTIIVRGREYEAKNRKTSGEGGIINEPRAL